MRLSALVCRLAHLHPLLHPLLQRMALCVICCQCTDCDSVFRTCAVCQEMPRYRGVGMPKAKKKTVEQPSEAVEEPPAPPPATDPPNPPSPEAKQVKRVRPPQSPGMKEVKAAAYDARKAAFASKKASKMYFKKSALAKAKKNGIYARIWAIGREHKKAKKNDNIRFIYRVNEAELQLKDVDISVLEEQAVALVCLCDALEAENDAKEARIARLSRKLRVRSRKM